MVRINDIQSAMLHIVGWEQSYNTAEIYISDSLTHSESGIYFQQVHPLLTLQNLSSIAPDFNNVAYDEYDAGRVYKIGEVVSYNNLLYKSLQQTEGNSPDDTNFWEETNPFSEWLESKTKASIVKAVNRYINDKIVKGTYKQLCENRTLFDSTGRLVDTIKNQDNMVGFEIVPIRSKGVTTKINKIGFQSNGTGEFDLYIYNSSLASPYHTIRVNKNKPGFMWIITDDLYLPYETDEIDAGGSWYICYKQSDLDLTNQLAIRKDKDWSKEPCGNCSRRELQAWQAWSKYLEIHPFSVNEEVINGETLWDVENNIYDYTTNFGLNLDISVKCDITDFIVAQKMLFQDVIAKQVAIDFLREFAYNPNVRTNRNSINASRVDILYEIDGDSSSMKKSGLSYQLDLAFKAIELSTEGIDRVCMPCKNNGIRYMHV